MASMQANSCTINKHQNDNKQKMALLSINFIQIPYVSNSASSAMASSSKMNISLLLLCLSFFALFSPSSLSRVLPSDSQKVSVGLYYESLCPYSADFIVDYLAKLFSDDLISIVDLKLVPWGNAKLRGNNTFVCQHGPNECLLNTVEACAIDAWPDLVRLSPLVVKETNSESNEQTGPNSKHWDD